MIPVQATIIAVLALVLFTYVMFWLLSNAYRKVGPNEALVVYGMGTGPHGKVVTNGGTFVFPMFQQYDVVSLGLRSFDVAPSQAVYTQQGVPVHVEAVTQLQVRSDVESILTAAQQTARKTEAEIDDMIRLVMEGHLRGVVGQLKVEDLVTDPETVSERMRELAAADMANMGQKIVSFTIKQIQDDTNYIENMGLPAAKRKQNETDIAAAEFERELKIRRAEARREADEKAALQELARVAAVAESDAGQFKSDMDRQIKEADSRNALNKHMAEIALVPDIERAIQQRLLADEQARTQEAQMRVKEMDLQISLIAAAKTEAQRVQILADAEKQREILEADGRAAGRRKVAEAEADALRLRGIAEADVIRAQGAAEAEAMQVRAAAYREYGEAAMLDKLITNLPEVVRALAEPLSKVDKITIISTGGADGANLGASRLTGDMVNMVSQVQGIVQALTGHDLRELMTHIPGLKETIVEGSAVKSNGDGKAATHSDDGEAAAVPVTTDGSAQNAGPRQGPVGPGTLPPIPGK
jgi:flotillin